MHGFSLAAREWGELLVEHFAEIRFRDDAFDRLVLDPDTKRLVKGLVEDNNMASKRRVHGGSAARAGAAASESEDGSERERGEERPAQRTDIVDGKGGGLVIALHGPPGTGKTLTAQAVAETLRVPLYTVGAGSLGVQADVLEKRLRDVLDVAEQWGATLLIDEVRRLLRFRFSRAGSRTTLTLLSFLVNRPTSSSPSARSATCSATPWSRFSCACSSTTAAPSS